MSELFQPSSIDEFAYCLSDINNVFNIDARFPTLPFTLNGGYISLAEFYWIQSGPLGILATQLMDYYKDEYVTYVVLDPDPVYFIHFYDYFPAFRSSYKGGPDQYWEGVSYIPHGRPTGSIENAVDVGAIVGSSGKWGFWGQRDWEFLLLSTPDNEGPWLHEEVPFFELDQEVLDDIRGPKGWSMPITDEMYAKFFNNIRTYESKFKTDSS